MAINIDDYLGSEILTTEDKNTKYTNIDILDEFNNFGLEVLQVMYALNSWCGHNIKNVIISQLWGNYKK